MTLSNSTAQAAIWRSNPRGPRERAADADALGAGFGEGLERRAGHQRAEDVHRLSDRATHRAHLLQGGQAGRVEHVGTGVFEGAKPSDRVVQIVSTADVILRASGQRKREGKRASSLDSRADALDRELEIVDPASAVVLD